MMTFEEWEVKYFFETHNYSRSRDIFRKEYGDKYSPCLDAWCSAAGFALGSWPDSISRANASIAFHAWIFTKREFDEDFTIKEAWENGHIWGVMKRDELRRMGGQVFS